MALEAIAVSFTAWSEAEGNSGPGIGFWNLKAHLSNIPAVTRPHLLQSGHASQSFSSSFTHWSQAFKHISLWKPLPFRLPHLGSWTEYEGESKLSTQYSSLSAFWQESQYNQLHGLPRTISSPWRLSVLCNWVKINPSFFMLLLFCVLLEQREKGWMDQVWSSKCTKSLHSNSDCLWASQHAHHVPYCRWLC